MAKQKQAADGLAANGYLASDSELAKLARDYVNKLGQAEGVRGSFLKILVAHSLKELKAAKPKKLTVETRLEAVEKVHSHLYAVVLEAITTPDIAPADDLEGREKSRRAFERNRRSTFARTAKSALSRWVKAGGKLEKLVPAEVRKDELQKLYQRERRGPVPIAQRVDRVEKKLESLVKKLINDDPDAAKEMIEEFQHRLSALVAPSPRPLTRTKRKVGEVTLHPH